jgi:ABC-type multidrug transport system ATPase subunit
MEPGTATFIKGPSGCGTTSLFRKISNAAGYKGDLCLPSSIRRIAFVMHEPTLIPWLSLEENLVLEAKMRKLAAPLSVFRTLLSEINLEVKPNKPSQSLSLGMRQRAEIARAISFSPELLLLDEAWSGVDAEGRLAMFDILDKFLSRGECILLATTHSDIDLLRFGNRIYCFEGFSLPSSCAETGTDRKSRIKMSTGDLWNSAELSSIIGVLAK